MFVDGNWFGAELGRNILYFQMEKISFKLLAVVMLVALIGCASKPKQVIENGPELQQEFVNKSASYYCYGNKNFMPCINRNIELETQACMDYVAKNSKRCFDLHIKDADLTGYNAVKKIGVSYTQCSMIEMLEYEEISFQSFERCFKTNYRESNINKKIKE